LTSRRDSKTRYRGSSRSTALRLFGVPWGRQMESKEDRESLALVLRLSPNPRMQLLAAQALDPIFKHTSFSKLAENNGLNYHMLSTEYKEIQRSVGFIRAAQHLPDLMEQVAVDAKSTWQPCKRCQANGTIGKPVKDDKGEVVRVEEETCTACKGEGKVYVLGDADRLKLTLEMFQLTGKSGGLNVNLDLRKVEPHENMSSLAESIAPILDGNAGPEKDDPA
jgi:hypothetical protein